MKLIDRNTIHSPTECPNDRYVYMVDMIDVAEITIVKLMVYD